MRRWCLLLLLATLACRNSHEQPTPQMMETALRDNLNTIRKAIDNFRQDKGRYPYTLQELVPNHIRRIPIDPITGTDSTWQFTSEETVRPSDDFSTSPTIKSETVIIDVRSGAPGMDSSGKRYADY